MQMRKVLLLSLIAGASVAFSACTDSPTSPVADVSPMAARNVRAMKAQSRDWEQPTVSRFSVTLEAHGPFVPGKRINVTITTTNNLDTRGTQVSLLLPEGTAARGRGWKSGAPAVDTEIIPEFHELRVIQAGARNVTQTSIEFGAPGLYSVIAKVAAPEDAPRWDAGRLVQNLASAVLWIYVDAKGGRTLSRYDPSLVPADMVTEPGPAMLLIPICDELNPCDPPPDDPPPPATYSLLVTYFNVDRSVVEPLKNAAVTVSDYPYGATYSGQTDQAGRISVPCPADPGGTQRMMVRAVTPGQFQIQDYWSSAAWTLADVVQPAGFCSGGATTTVQTTDIGASWLHQQMLATVQPSRSLFQISRGFLGVNYDVNIVENTSLFRTDIDEIVVAPRHLYGEFGRVMVAHEYGHAFAHASLGGARGGGCPAEGHTLWGEYTMRCALSEGWANYHAAIVRRTDVPDFHADLLFKLNYQGGDGSRIEANVANFLLVMTHPDPIRTFGSSVDRGLHYPPSYAAATLRDCRWRLVSSPVWLSVWETDVLVWCFEGGVDWGVYQSYFTSRGSNYNFWPAAQQNAAPRPWNWSQANIRATWLRSLYGVGS
jgi:hypothetical protein